MALINCPECGGSVSSQAEICPHCGVQIRVCPECKKVIAGNVEQCPDCGYFFKTSENDNLASNQKEDKKIAKSGNKDLEERWKDSSPTDWVINKLLEYSVYLLLLVSVICCIAIFTTYNSWNKLDDAFEKLANADDVLNTINTLICVVCVIASIPILDLKEIFYKIKFSNWLRENNIDLKQYIKNNELKSGGFYHNQLCNIFYDKENPKHIRIFIIKSVVKFIFTVIFEVLFYNFATDCCNQQIKAWVYYGSEFAADHIEYDFAPLIIGIIVLVIDTIVSILFNAYLKKNRNEWLRVNGIDTGEHYEK